MLFLSTLDGIDLAKKPSHAPVPLNRLSPERDKKHTMIDLRGISPNWFKNQFYPSRRLSRLRGD
jgi:hypothetical protein